MSTRHGAFRSPLRVLALGVAACALGLFACASVPDVPLGANEACFREVAGTLADDTMEGRGIGTRGLRRSGAYLGRLYREVGLEPPHDGSPAPSYHQQFLATTGVTAASDNRLEWRREGDTAARPLRDRDEFRPFGFSSSAEFEGDLVFGGYGLVAEPYAYDDFAGIDVEGKVVLAMRYEPGEADPDSPFEGKRPSRFSDLRYKSLKAREAGAVALIFVAPPDGEEDRLPRTGHVGAVSDAGIPVLQVEREVAKQWFEAAGQDFAAAYRAIEADYRPHSRALSGVRVSGMTHLQASRTSLENLLGILPGRGDLASETVVVGAHFDHLGRGGSGSLTPDRDEVHNGADDNASGVAAMVCGVATTVAQLADDEQPRRTLLVASFSGEETGLLGSNYYVRNPVRPMESTVAMVNLDMVGRLRDDRLHAMGADSSPGWRSILDPIAERRGFDLIAGGDGYGPSDQMSFYAAGVPVVHFFTGSHSEYHTPDDDIESLNLRGGARIAGLLAESLSTLLHREERLAFQASSHSSMMAGDSRGFGAYLGSVPDYADMMSREGGVLLSGVRKGGPADLAGITGGDRIVEMDGTQIQNLYDMTFVLRDHRPGEIIEIVFLRDGRPMTVRATLGRRGGRGAGSTSDESPHRSGS